MHSQMVTLTERKAIYTRKGINKLLLPIFLIKESKSFIYLFFKQNQLLENGRHLIIRVVLHCCQ